MRAKEENNNHNKGRYTLDIFARAIEIKRFCNKRDNFEPSIYIGQALNELQSKVLYVSLRAYLGWSLKPVALNYLLSQYRVQKCLVCISPN